LFQSGKFSHGAGGFALPGVPYRKKNITDPVPTGDSHPDVAPATRERDLLCAEVQSMSAQGAGHLLCRSQVTWRLLHVSRGIAQLLHLSLEFSTSNEAGLGPAAGDMLDRLQQVVVNPVNET